MSEPVPAAHEPVIRLTLDTSAVLAYAQGSIDVGETLAEIASERDLFAVHVLCLAEAARFAGDGDVKYLPLLAAHRCCVLVGTPAQDWQELAGTARMLNRTDLAATLRTAATLDTFILTGEPGRYPHGDEYPKVIEF